jgi:2-polyprenyl-6-methoxyphenol hydroxylase-like FAD-dependent oxidoreductase
VSSRKLHHVLIVGGGVAGPALALFLKKAGISSAVYESHSYTEGVGGGLGLAPNGMKVLAALGLADKLRAGATTITRFDFRNARGSVLGTIALDPSAYGQPMMGMSRALLFETLAGELRAQGIEHHCGKAVLDAQEINGRTVARFDDGTTSEGDLLVGADGARSVVRKCLLPAAEAQFTGLIGIGGFVPLSDVPELAPATMTFVFGGRGFFGYSGADGGTAMWWTNLFRDQAFTPAELRDVHPEEMRRELTERFGGYHAPLSTLIARTGQFVCMNVTDVQSLPAWHRGRIMLIGDAAHAVSPNSGQGASLALEDAMYLAKLLRDCDDFREAYGRFERDRKPRAERVVAEGRRRGGDKALVGPVRQWVRERLISLFVRLSGDRNDRWLYEYSIGW